MIELNLMISPIKVIIISSSLLHCPKAQKPPAKIYHLESTRSKMLQYDSVDSVNDMMYKAILDSNKK
jgi:hypothetical protein